MQYTETQNIKATPNNGNEENVYEKDTHNNSSQDNNYDESTQNLGKTNNVGGYYTVTHENNPSLDANNIQYTAPGINESGIQVDPTTMQAAAAINQSLMFQNNGAPIDYPNYHMFNGMNTMYGGIPQYYGGMHMPMNPYYDPYGIINPLSCAPLNIEKTKKKTKKFYCC
ncbi:conserved Plasmodium protein, unknown function [Plasmodium relictum]|uniref:Uncharacterized protein n=1 Tax=Plasmodium relictum TaxID=85471 RepID=A0A1J1H6I2_PLARL|nr:conserved Plasmodium protein, unknown function [Plasmodium relictum]CRH00275.1 conserved Plasmodium protein, unknown function [Plasmodium relictum]